VAITITIISAHKQPGHPDDCPLSISREQESIAKFGIDPPAVISSVRNGRVGQLYRTLTHHWFHNSALNLLINMVFLASTGESLERAVGTTPFILLVFRMAIAQSAVLLAMFASIPDRSSRPPRDPPGIPPMARHCS
jgi:membrane associated rhomboid family serine protease